MNSLALERHLISCAPYIKLVRQFMRRGLAVRQRGRRVRPNYALNLPGGPRRAARVLAALRTRPSAAFILPGAGCVRPARRLTLIR